MDHTHKTAVVRRKHKTMVYMKYGHVSSYWSSPAVGTRRVCRAVLRASIELSVVAIPAISSPLHPHQKLAMLTEHCAISWRAQPTNSHRDVRATNGQR